jgi:HIRAN domain
MRSYPSWIAGLRYRGPDGTNRSRYCVRNLNPGTELDPFPEPSNPHDDHAVAVKHRDHHLGYIPARHAWIAKALIDENEALDCKVNKIETVGWLFPRASFVGLRVAIIEDRQTAKAGVPTSNHSDDMARVKLEHKARDACLDGLRVLDYIAPPSHSFSSEMNIEASYIEARLAMSGFEHDPALVDTLLGVAQGMVVRKPSFVRAVNAIAAHDEHYKLVCDAAKQLVEISGPNAFQSEALNRLLAPGRKFQKASVSKSPPIEDTSV